jgi:predicted HicB family RNase H-like nuclease
MRANPIQYHIRLPVDLHAQLKAEANEQGIPLHTLLLVLLAGAISFDLKDD